MEEKSRGDPVFLLQSARFGHNVTQSARGPDVVPRVVSVGAAAFCCYRRSFSHSPASGGSVNSADAGLPAHGSSTAVIAP